MHRIEVDLEVLENSRMSPTILDDSYLFVGAVILVGVAGFLIGYKERR